jgi:hypothetical protein
MKFLRRLSLSPGELAIARRTSPGGNRCPAIWELDTGDIAVVGDDITDKVKNVIPSEVNLGTNERIIVIPREVLKSVRDLS